MLFYRGLVFLIFLTYILLGPAVSQVLNIHYIYLPRWIMFTGAGHEIFDIKFIQVLENGEVELDYLRILDLNYHATTPKNLKQITSEDAVKEIGKHLCASLGLNTHILIRGKRGTRTLWAEYSSRNKNICEENF